MSSAAKALAKDEKFIDKHLKMFKERVKKKDLNGCAGMYLNAVAKARKFEQILGSKRTEIDIKNRQLEKLRARVKELENE
jgi:hypothetical protein